MRVALDYRPALHGRGGIAVYAEALAAALARVHPEDELHLYGHRLRPGTARGVVPPEGAHLHARPWPSLGLTVAARFGWGADRVVGGADVVHWTDYTVLPVTRAAVVATIHDVLFETLPHCYTPRMRAGLRSVTRRIVRRADRLIVPSARTRDALLALHRVPGERIDVVPHGVRPLPDAAPAGDLGPYFLCVGTLEPRKNWRRVLDAHAALERRGFAIRLVVAGPRGWMDDALVEAIGGRSTVVWDGRASPERLAALYRGAVALVYPSLGEGFGLPVLEAMSVGCPVIVGEDTATADLAGDAGLAVDPLDVGAIGEALERMLEDDALRARLGAAGRRRAASYTWDDAARATHRVYERAVAG